MSTPTSEPATDQATEPEPQQGDPADALGDGGKKALDAERKRAAAAEREAKALKARLDEIEQANLSEIERAQKAAADATAQLAEYQRTTMRQKVALSKGLPADLVDRLRGDSEEEVSADADALLALVKAPTTPRPDLSQGGHGGEGATGGPEKDFENFLRTQMGH